MEIAYESVKKKLVEMRKSSLKQTIKQIKIFITKIYKQMKTATIIFISFIFVITSQNMNSQPWIKNVKSENPSFYELQSAFNGYWKDYNVNNGKYIENGKTIKAYGWKQFKRWEWYWEQRVSNTGEFPKSSIIWDEWKNYINNHPETTYKTAKGAAIGAANWTFMGPSTTPGGYNGLGRLNCIAFHPTDIMTMWVGSPAGGLWKTTDQGVTWTTNTDDLPVLGISDIAIDYTNPNIIYIATGDGDAAGALTTIGSTAYGDTKSIGILKSTDGGNTWNTTGMNWNVTSAKLIRRLQIHPTNPQILLAATSDGIYKTTNGGSTWTNQQSGWFMDLEFKPNDPTIVYASTFDGYYGNAQIFRSTNTGSNWTQVTSLTGIGRINLAVTPDWPDLVDALCVNTSYGLEGLYYSKNSGASFKQYFYGTNSNNLLNNSYNASGSGGQGYYDLAYAINPNNSSDIWLGGVNTWNSTDGGNGWSLKTIWNSGFPTSAKVVHADKHFFAFHPLNSDLFYECNDGGLYTTNDSGVTWYDLSNGLQISQIYRLGTSATIKTNVIIGLQDNGSREIYSGQWHEQTGGDGMECIIDYSDANIEYASYANGIIYRTYDFWANQTTISANIPEQPQGAWVTPFVIDPVNPQTLYAGYNNLYKTTNRGDSWIQISNLGSADKLISLAVAPSDPLTIYTATFDTLYITSDGGSRWFYSIPNTSLNMTYIAIHSNDPLTLWVTFSGYTAGQKVYKSINGGATWTNISGTLPNLPVNCIVYENGSNDGLYIGTDVGVYYRDASMSDWIQYNTDLPNVVVTELEIQYNTNKLLAATFGRGLWQSDLNTPYVNSPIASFVANNTNVCQSICIDFTDNSTNNPTSWSWSFSGGSPSTSTLQNPTNICYNTSGIFDVTLIATNSGGSDTIVMPNYITVNNLPNANAGTNVAICEGGNTILNASGGTSYSWSPSTALSSTNINNPTASPTYSITYTVIVTDGNGCTDTDNVTVTVNSLPPMPAITQISNYLESSATTGNQWYESGSLISGATNQIYTPNQNGSYTVIVTDGNACSSESAPYNFVVSFVNSKLSDFGIKIFPNPTTGIISITGNNIELIEILNIEGQIIKEVKERKQEYNIDLSSFSKGTYMVNIVTNEGSMIEKIVLE